MWALRSVIETPKVGISVRHVQSGRTDPTQSGSRRWLIEHRRPPFVDDLLGLGDRKFDSAVPSRMALGADEAVFPPIAGHLLFDNASGLVLDGHRIRPALFRG